MVHVSLLCVDRDAPWTVITPAVRPEDPGHLHPKDRSRSSFVDVAASSYMLLHTARLPLSSITPSSQGLGAELSFVSDGDSKQICEDLSVLPLSTTKLIRVPNGMGHSAISMLDVHLLHTVHSPFSSLTIPDRETHADITRNYHELSVLADYRWKLNENPLLPFHLAALDAMDRALDSALDH
jgi:mediator of RNA polymerase II transcription subunit 13, fungi type